MTAVHLYDCVPAGERRPLALIAADALAANCGSCRARPGRPCDAAGMHLARFARARRRGVIGPADMAVVLGIAAPRPEDVFMPATVIPAGAAARHETRAPSIPQPRKAADWPCAPSSAPSSTSSSSSPRWPPTPP